MTSRYNAAISIVFEAQGRAHSGVYVTEAATRKTGERASEIGKLVVDGTSGPGYGGRPLERTRFGGSTITRILGFLATLLALFCAAGAGAEPVVGHALEVRIDPEQGTLAVQDTLDLPADTDEFAFTLHRGLNPRVAAGNAVLRRTGSRDHLETYRLEPTGAEPVTLSYSGRIRHGLEETREGMGRSRQWSRGTIDPRGVVLDGYSGWYPNIPDSLQRFDLDIRLPPGWIAVSQGAGPERSTTEDGVRIGWRETQPQDDIYLMAATFEFYQRPTPFGEAQVYLREPDADLAGRYLDATARYLALYSRLIGPYPYAKFALVENFWETGYGMPSFTLLGPRVIRLPFIIHTSYPHEVLHNWWGNGVFVDYASGNWSEGLTAYLADHLLKEERGGGPDYRRDTLRSYADYVSNGDDFPIREFRGRHGSASQAIGYGKTLMMVHMLRRDLGDQAFIAGLRRFYRDNRFRIAGFDDLRRSFEQESGRDLADFFAHWTRRTGAPTLSLSDVTLDEGEEGYRLRGRLTQAQAADPYPLTVPLVVHLENGEVVDERIALPGRQTEFAMDLASRPLRLAVDPGFDLFRTLVAGESPVTLSALFGAKKGMLVLPSDAPPGLANAYLALADAWGGGTRGWTIVADNEIDQLPDDRAVWILGWSNRFLNAIETGPELELEPGSQALILAGHLFLKGDNSAALVQNRGAHPIGWVVAGGPDALPGLARKLPHYGKYSYLAFTGQEPTNRLKGQWAANESLLTVWLTDRRQRLVEPIRAPLTDQID